LVLHALVLGILAATSIGLWHEDRRVIPLVIREPAPPPPPPGGGAGAGPAAPVVATAEPPKFVEQPKPIEAPKPVEKPKIAAKPKPKHDVVHAAPTPAAASVPTAEVASVPAPAGGERGGGVAGGVVGGIPGGVVGGKLGGRLGGTGDDVWSIDQVAVPPKVLDSVRPQYPPIARARGQEGVVIVQAVIDRRGAVEPDALHVVKSQPPFDDAALAAFRQWKFQPGRDGSGQAVRVLVQQPIRFQLR
jgi:protein TonB